jgi:hypothetical protein
MRIPAYLRLSRHGIYFFRICIPLPLQRRWQIGRELKVSLRTRDQRSALARARDLAIAAHKHFGYLRNVEHFGWNHKRVYRIYRELQFFRLTSYTSSCIFQPCPQTKNRLNG